MKVTCGFIVLRVRVGIVSTAGVILRTPTQSIVERAPPTPPLVVDALAY